MSDSKAKAEIIESPVEFSGQLHIDKDDVIAVAVTQAELHMNTQMENALQRKKEAEQEVELLKEQVNDLILDDFQKKSAKQVDSLLKVINAFGVTFLPQYEAVINTTYEKGKVAHTTYTGHVKFSRQEDDHFSKGTSFSPPHFSLTLPLKASVVKLVKKWNEAGESIKTHSDEAMEWKKRLTKVPQLERQYKARLAQTRLSKSAAGREVLSQLTGSIQNDVLALPGK